MKRYVYVFLVLILFFASCLSYKALNLNHLTIGMTVEQVQRTYGPPRKVLETKRTNNGFLQVLEYRNRHGEVYALEFWDNYLVGYDFLYDDYPYIAPVAPPGYYPSFGSSIIIVHGSGYYNSYYAPGRYPSNYRPRPPFSRPTGPVIVSPSNRPGSNTHPPVNNNRPNNNSNNNQTRPPANSNRSSNNDSNQTRSTRESNTPNRDTNVRSSRENTRSSSTDDTGTRTPTNNNNRTESTGRTSR